MVGKGTRWAPTRPRSTRCASSSTACRMDGIVVIGEGEKDEAPMLSTASASATAAARGRRRGRSAGGHDAHGQGQAERTRGDRAVGAQDDVRPRPIVYMEKIAGADDIADLLDLDRALGRRSGARRGAPRQGRPRHRGRHARPPTKQEHRRGARVGARVRLISHGDVSAALLAVSDNSPVDVMFGIGGTPEGVISAAATKCSAAGSSGTCGRATTPSATPRSRPATTSTASSTRMSSSRATTASSPRPA